jgi:GntR family transcriptional regulator of arabinose operon
MRKNVSTDEVKNFVLDYVKKNKIAEGSRLPSLRVIAAESGASMPTVQRAIAMLVSEGHLVSKLGSGTFVAEKSNSSSNIIGVISPHFDNHIGNFISDTVIGIKEKIQSSGYCPVLLEPPSGIWGNERSAEALKLIKRFLDLGVCGLIIDASVPSGSPLWQSLRHLPVPVVCFNNCDNSFDLNYVATDNYSGGAMAAKHFLEKGHKKLAIVASNFSETSSVIERVKGFQDELAKHGPEIGKAELITLKSSSKEKFKAIEHYKPLFEKVRDVSGIFAVNDSLAIELMTAFRNTGLSIPEDMSFIGFDNSSLCEHVNPRLTSVSQAGTRMGTRAVEILLQMTGNPNEYQESVQIRLAPKLIVRDSVADLN